MQGSRHTHEYYKYRCLDRAQLFKTSFDRDNFVDMESFSFIVIFRNRNRKTIKRPAIDSDSWFAIAHIYKEVKERILLQQFRVN